MEWGVLMAELLPCPFCGSAAHVGQTKKSLHLQYSVSCSNPHCIAHRLSNPFVTHYLTVSDAIKAWNTRTPKERGVDKPKITCLNCRHLMFSDCYGECNKQLRIVNPSDTCEYAEPKERGGEK